MNIFKELDVIVSALKPSEYRPLWKLYNYSPDKADRKDYDMRGDILHYSTKIGTSKIRANPNLKHAYDALFGNKYRLVIPVTASIDVDTESTIYEIIHKARSEEVSLLEVIRGILYAASYYFKVAKKDLEEARNAEISADELKYASNDDDEIDIVDNPDVIYYCKAFFIEGMYSTEFDERKTRIGKILEFGKKKNPSSERKEILTAIKYYHLLKPVKNNENHKKIVIISRHPYDIAGMSTDRGWISCMDLRGGMFSEYVPSSIAGGVLIAYLCNDNDTNITRPVGRILIKPYIYRNQKINFENPNFILVCSKKYGAFPNTITEMVQKWFNEHWNSKLKLKPGKYDLTKYAYQEDEDDSEKDIETEEDFGSIMMNQNDFGMDY